MDQKDHAENKAYDDADHIQPRDEEQQICQYVGNGHHFPVSYTHLDVYKRQQFYLDGEKFHIYAGAIHYFRTVPEYWEDRLRKLKLAGFNTVETLSLIHI